MCLFICLLKGQCNEGWLVLLTSCVLILPAVIYRSRKHQRNKGHFKS